MKQFLTINEVAEMLGFSERKAHEIRNEPWFPDAYSFGERCLRWDRDEVIDAIRKNVKREKKQTEPSRLKQSRASIQSVTKHLCT